MKRKSKLILLFFLILSFNYMLAQSSHTVDFESPELGAGWDWSVSENDDNPPLEFVANPVSGGINTSATVAKFTARQNGNPWALCFTDGNGVFTFDANNSTVKLMVYKSRAGNVNIKFEGQGPVIEKGVLVETLNEWFEVTIDFSDQIGNSFSRIVILPDLDGANARTQDEIVYFDNLYLPDGEIVGPLPEPTEAAPLPVHDETNDNVFSIFSDSYTNLEGTNFNPGWGQSTVFSNVDFNGNNTIKYEGLNYQGTALGDSEGADQDLTGYTHFHVDFWTPNANTLDFFLISRSSGEQSYSLPITAEQWISVEIPLSHFSDLGLALSDVFQFKVTGNGTVYFDNWYFYTGEETPTEPAEPAPAPIHDATSDNVLSIFSDSYTNLEGTNFNPNWGQATQTLSVEIQGNNTLKYGGLNFQGTNLGSEEGTDQDLSGYTHLHVDFWTPNSTVLDFFLISRSSGEHPYSLPITTEQWVSMDILLSHYSGLGLSLNDIFQFKVEGDGTVFFDNWYFYGTVTSVEDEIGVAPTEYFLEQNYPNPFNPTTKIKFAIVESNHVTLKIMNILGEEVAVLVDGYRNAGSYEVNFNATSLSSGTYIYSITSGNYSAVKKMLLIK